jgi:PKHD-type hydroxylase
MLFPIFPKNTTGKDTHAFCDNIFSSDEINAILALPEWLQTEDGVIGGNQENRTVNHNIRRSKIAWISPNKDTMFIWEKIAAVVSDINASFFRFDLSGCYEPIQLSIYDSSIHGGYEWHVDAGIRDNSVPRKLSMTLALSDPLEYDGGELQIKPESDVPITLATPKGRAWFFPSYTLHRVAPVTRGIRRSLVIWVGGPEFK